MDLKPRQLFKRVVDFALSEIERRSRPPQRLSSFPAASSDLAPKLHPPPRAPLPGVAGEILNGLLPLEVTRSSLGAVTVRWSLGEADIEAARSLSSAEANLAVRVVSFSTDERALVQREVRDLPAGTTSGFLTLQPPKPQRLVVAVGLLAGDSFVSVVHAQLD